ncbi:MAG: NADH-quinone oxidoreductase subunit C [Bacteroidia bacterium]|nr:NADH-quinone oxidoreductase subunit C [Bacteroidia bacterium]
MDAFFTHILSQTTVPVLGHSEYAGQVTIAVSQKDLFSFLKLLKEQFGFDYFSDLANVDHFTDENRFELIYNLLNLAENKRLFVSCRLSEESLEVESVVSLWPAANWNERETYDMMGISFKNHPDLRRMYMPEDFEYFPMRKDFPLLGIPGSIQLPEKALERGYK